MTLSRRSHCNCAEWPRISIEAEEAFTCKIRQVSKFGFGPQHKHSLSEGKICHMPILAAFHRARLPLAPVLYLFYNHL